MGEPNNQMSVHLPEGVVGGHYADFAAIWHTPDYFVFDFAVLAQPPAVATAPDGSQVNVAEAQVVTRVRVPPSQVIEIMKALGQQLDSWERETGQKPPHE